MTNDQRVPFSDSKTAIDEPPTHPSQAQRRELWKGKTWEEMTASERATYAARKRWDARRDAQRDARYAGGNARHDAQQSAATPSTAQVENRLSTPVSGLAAGVLAETREVLLSIIRDPNALDTSKVQAARVLAMLESERHEGTTDEVALWLARRDALELLPAQDRMVWLDRQINGIRVRTPEDGLDGLLGSIEDYEAVAARLDAEENQEGSWIEPPSPSGP